MSFRFRRSVSIAPGVRINFGKTGASISAGVRGARVTFGRGGGRATVGIPGTGVTYSQKVGSKKVRSGKVSVVLLIIPLLIIGILVRLSSHGTSDSQELTPVMIVVTVLGIIGLVAALRRRSDGKAETIGDDGAVEPQQLDADQPDVSGLAAEPNIPPPRLTSLKAIMREAAAKKQRRKEEESLAQEEYQLAETLGRYKCFYKHNGETLGPVTLWQVREMIETDLFDPDVQVILEGSDYWYTYAEQELRVAPPSSGDTKALRVAAKLQCHYLQGEATHGPVSLLVIFHKIRLGELPADVQIRADGSDQWRRASDV